MKLQPGIHRTSNLDLDETKKQAEKTGYKTFVLPAEGILGKVSFFEALTTTLSLDPSVIDSRSWDGLADFLWQSLYELPSRQIAILWPNSQIMAFSAPAEYEIALSVFVEVVTLLMDSSATNEKPKAVAFVVEFST